MIQIPNDHDQPDTAAAHMIGAIGASAAPFAADNAGTVVQVLDFQKGLMSLPES